MRRQSIGGSNFLAALWTAVALVPVLGASTDANGASAVKTLDFERTLVSRDVGSERWAITHNFDGDGTVTGNVFFPDGGDPAFVWCEDVSADPLAAELSFSCFGADSCVAAPCPLADWSFVADVRLPRSFLEVVEMTAWVPIGDPVELPSAFFAPVAGDAPGDRESGLQVTPDRARVLISKDVGGERWAITRNFDDATVTGNVFSPGGGEPAFLWCEDVSDEGKPDVVRLSCFLAEAGVPPSPTPSATPTPTPSPTPTPTPTPTATPTPTPTRTPVPTPTPLPGLATGEVCSVLDDQCAAPYDCIFGNPSRCSTAGKRYPRNLPGCLSTPISDPCEVGYYCGVDTLVSGICVGKLARGSACTPIVGAPCIEGTSCAIVSIIPPRAECQ
jgi:hypothetical protein